MLARALVLTASAMLATTALAGPTCTDAPREKWITPVEMLTKAIQDVPTLKVFKVTDGNCYEIYGWGAKGEKLEIYYHPVTGEIAKKGSW